MSVTHNHQGDSHRPQVKFAPKPISSTVINSPLAPGTQGQVFEDSQASQEVCKNCATGRHAAPRPENLRIQGKVAVGVMDRAKLLNESWVCNNLACSQSAGVDGGFGSESGVPGTVLWYPSKVAPKDTMKQMRTT